MTAERPRDPATEPASVTASQADTAPTTDEAQRTASATAAVPAGGIDAGAVDAPVDAPTADAPAADAPTADAAAPDATTSVVTPAVPVSATIEPTKESRRPVIIASLRRLVTFALVIALFVGGVALGQTAFQRTRPISVGVGGAVTVSDPPPAVTQEFIRALAANDADAMRSSLSAQPNKDLTDEFERFSIKRIVSIETLGTHIDGTRSATEILMRAEKTDGLPFEVNLVILVDGGQIEGFR